MDKKLPKHYETLAQAIVASGRLRIDAGHESNFTRVLLPGVMLNQAISLREMNDPKLHAKFLAHLNTLLARSFPPDKIQPIINQYLALAREELRKKAPPSAELELMTARTFVLCNELAVIWLIHLEEAEIFISFGQSVGDVMDVVDWQKFGDNNGMQAVGGNQNAVYVSCGGHPFLEDDERTYTSDGFPALARFMVIAAQETGHNGDMIRNKNGVWVGRYSAENWGARPSKVAGQGRKRDIAACSYFYDMLHKIGLKRLVEWERHLKFYRDNKVGGTRQTFAWLKCRIAWLVMRFLMIQRGMKALGSLPHNQYPATQMQKFFKDMLFNLSPQADVYQQGSPDEQEATACIEAVARMPQQVIKWGHKAVHCTCPNLYMLYYNTIIPGCVEAYNRIIHKQQPTEPHK